MSIKPFAVVAFCALAPWMSACSYTRSDLDFSLTNFTGGEVKYVYLSPNTSSRWGENILAGSDLKSGDTLEIRLNRNETAIMWDMRIEGGDGRYAEWKNLRLVDISQITLKLEPSPPLRVVAELE